MKDMKQRIEEDIASSGLPLEIESTSILCQDGWRVRNQVNYTDKDTGKERPLDIIADKTFSEEYKNHKILNFNLVIECKRDVKPWVFFSTPKEKDVLTKAIMQAVYYHHFANPKIKEFYRLIFQSHYSKMSSEQAVIHYEPFKGEKKEKIQEAKYHVVKGVISQLEKAKKYFEIPMIKRISKMVSFYLPVIIFEGPLFQLKFEKDELKVHKTEYLQYQLVYSDKFFLIDVVSKKYFLQYLTMINEEIEAIRTRLK